jgi:hypothetical protein
VIASLCCGSQVMVRRPRLFSSWFMVWGIADEGVSWKVGDKKNAPHVRSVLMPENRSD